jgi:hypothetical protein
MKLRAVLTAAMLAVAPACATAKQETEARPYTIVRENVTVNLGNSVDTGFAAGRDGSSIVFREGRRWYRVELLPPCSRNLGAEIRIGLVHRGPWFDRGSQVIVGEHVCHVRRIDEIAEPNEEEAPAQADS